MARPFGKLVPYHGPHRGPQELKLHAHVDKGRQTEVDVYREMKGPAPSRRPTLLTTLTPSEPFRLTTLLNLNATFSSQRLKQQCDRRITQHETSGYVAPGYHAGESCMDKFQACHSSGLCLGRMYARGPARGSPSNASTD